ncbi:MAG: magnesium transporter [Pseudomonadota bacterium]
MPPVESATATEDQRERLLETLQTTPSEHLGQVLADVHPALLADVLEAVPPERRLELWNAADPHARGETLTELHDDVALGLAAAVEPDTLGAAMAPLQPDELADLEPLVPPAALDAALADMEPGKRRRFDRVRAYPEDVAGGLMDVDALTVGPRMTLAEALDLLRRSHAAGGGPPEHLNSFFVVDDRDRLVGVLPLTDAVCLDPATTVADAMSAVEGIAVAAPLRDVVRAFQDRDLTSAPVVNEHGALLGRITVDDVVDVLSNEAERSILAPAGLDEDNDLFAPLRTALGQRGVWLGINLVNAFVAAWVIGRFEDTIEQLVALAVLMPVVASMGGAAGQQSLALAIRGLALNQVGRGNRWRLLRREMTNGLATGTIFAVLVALVAFLWFGHQSLSLVIAAALIVNVFVGTSLGTLYPLVMKRVNIDPALAGGMALTATTDVLGFLALLGLASLVLI